LVLLIGGGMGWMVRSARVQRDAVAALERTHSAVFYNWQRARVGRFSGFKLDAAPPWPRWLVDRLGVDYFGHVVEVIFGGADADLAHVRPLGRLESLSIPITSSVTNAGLRHLEQMIGLRALDLPFVRMGDAGLRHLKGLTGLRSLGLTGTQVTNAGLEYLEGLAGLEELFLGHTEIGDAGLAHLGGLTCLRMLDLNTTKVTDSGLVHLKELTDLRMLDLAGTQVSDAGLVHLKGLAGLQELNLRKTRVTAAGAKEFQKAMPGLRISH
jgi:internalin A